MNAAARSTPAQAPSEWPPRSGRLQAFPEVDRAEWFDLDAAREKLIEGQRPLIERLQDLLRAPG